MENKMQNNKNNGFTLIEVILSLAIFAIISVGFLGVFSSVYINTFKSTALTEGSFYAQQLIEDEIAAVKINLESNIDPTGLTPTTVNLFSGTSQARSVVVYRLEETISTSQILETYVSRVRPPVLETPNIEGGVTIAASSVSGTVINPNIGMPSLSLDLGNELVVDNPGILIRYLYYWYMSNPGYYIPSSPPTFPDDYQIITDYTSRLITSVPDSFKGRFIKLVVTPVGDKGKMGTSVASNAIYISSMPINDNLVFHIDANYIDRNDSSQIGDNLPGSTVYNYVKKWNDIGPWDLNLLQSDPNMQPLLYLYTVDGTTTPDHNLLGVLGVSGGTSINLKSLSTPDVGSISNMTVYFAAKFDDTLLDSTILFQSKATMSAGNRWDLSIIANDVGSDQMVLNRYLASETRSLISTNQSFQDSTWKIFKLEIFQNKLSIAIDGADAGFDDSYSSTSEKIQFTDFKINFSNSASIGEILVFDTSHDSLQSAKIYEYLNDKYKPN